MLALATCRRFALLLKEGKQKEAAAAFWRAAQVLWPDPENGYYWNEWAHQMILDLIGNRRYAILGAKQSGKSTTVMAFSLVLFWGAWGKCSILYRTTTLDAAETRGWGEFVRLLEIAKSRLDLPGVYQKAKPPKYIRSQNSGDKKNAILCLPTKAQSESSNKTAQSGVKGFHTEYQLLIDDELNEMPNGVEDAPAALEAEWKVFRYVGIGNPNGWDNPLGRMATPDPKKLKRSSLYETGAPNRWPINGGVAIRLNAYESPNIVRGQNADGTWPYKHLPTPATIQMELERHQGDANHPLMWQFIRALPPPEDASAVILTHVFVSQKKADQRADFVGETTMVAGLDPAFTEKGDDAILQFAHHGICRDGIWRIEFLDAIKIPIAASEEQDAFYRVVSRAKAICKDRGVQPSNFAVDTSGSGMGIQSVLVREWSSLIHSCNSSGKPSRLKVVANPTAQDIREGRITGLDCFDRRVSEIYFCLRHFVECDQVRGLEGDAEVIVVEAAQRRYFNDNGKLSVISKRATYNNHGSSNHLDAACVIIDLLKTKGFLPGGIMSNRESIQEQVEREIDDKMGAIPAMAGPKNDSYKHAMAALSKISPGMFSNTESDFGDESDQGFDESGMGGF